MLPLPRKCSEVFFRNDSPQGMSVYNRLATLNYIKIGGSWAQRPIGKRRGLVGSLGPIFDVKQPGC